MQICHVHVTMLQFKQLDLDNLLYVYRNEEKKEETANQSIGCNY